MQNDSSKPIKIYKLLAIKIRSSIQKSTKGSEIILED
jgi:hypothetical protein